MKDWVLIPEYGYAVIKGGDPDHLNHRLWEPWYEVQPVKGLRKPWHAGSASFSRMFPDHVLIGDKLGGSVVFSLPQGKWRFDDALGAAGAQVALEFLISVDKPQRATAFAVDPVNREAFFYDVKEYNTVQGYKESLKAVCSKYGLACPGMIDAHDWEVKRFAFVVSLVESWHDPITNSVKEEAWAVAEAGLKEFSKHEAVIYKEMEATTPSAVKISGRP